MIKIIKYNDPKFENSLEKLFSLKEWTLKKLGYRYQKF